ncbi:MAG: N-acetylmuramoyl-L-alanine amidase [Armatimonadetes bacterium]|nr:N-acetylmuramoyl-L-alanine amidase [Armatimonadota bacterium]
MNAKDNNRIIALDAGHGANRGLHHTGCAANGLVEDELALDFVIRIGHNIRLAGIKTIVTRPDSRLVTLESRGKKAVEADCDLFVSIHINAGPATANGVEAFVAEGDRRSYAIAQQLVNRLAKHDLRNRGAKWDSQSQYSRLRVLRDTYRYMPSVLLEIGFLTNSHDAALLKDKYWRQRVSIDTAEGIIASLAK